MAKPPNAPSSAGLSSAAMQEARNQLEEAERLRQQGKFDRAESICHALTRRHPAYMAAFHTLGLVHLDRGNYERALDWLVRASMLDPRNWMTWTALSRVYLRLGATEMAADTLERARALNPQDPSILVSLAEILREERDYERAAEAYRQALALDAGLDSAAIGLGLCLSGIGEDAEAQEVFDRLFRRGHRSLDLFHAMTTLPPGTIGTGVLDALERLTPGKNADEADFKLTFSFVRGAALDAAGRHAEAWDCFLAGNRALAALLQDELREQRMRETTNLDALRAMDARPLDPDDSAPVSLFILGPSRSGKTSLERLAGSLIGVKRGYENPGIDIALRRTFQAAALPAARYLAQLPSPLYPDLRRLYRDEVTRRAGTARVFTNSAPARIHDAARIAAAIPNARFVLVRRDRDDTALRIFMTKYVRRNSYAYDLKSIHAHLDWYARMADIMAAKYPAIVRVIDYENMVADPLAALGDVAALCGLPMQYESLPAPGDDRGCAGAYKNWLAVPS